MTSCLPADRLAYGAGNMKLSLVAAVLLLLGAARAEEEDKKEDVGTVVGIDLGTTYSWYVGFGEGGNGAWPPGLL